MSNWVPMPAASNPPAGKKDKDKEQILADIRNILYNSPEGSAFAIQLFRAPKEQALQFAGAVTDVLGKTLQEVQEKAKETGDYKRVITPSLVGYGQDGMNIPQGTSLGKLLG